MRDTSCQDGGYRAWSAPTRAFLSPTGADNRDRVEPMVRELLENHQLRLRFGELVVHVEGQTLVEIRPNAGS